MSDVSDVEDIASGLDMNIRELARYELHLEDIKRIQKRVIFWRIINSICQIVFFWNIVAFAFQVARDYSAPHAPAVSSFLSSVIDLTSNITIWFGVASGFAFFFMIWTGIVRSKWEGKLTRATAYCLSFLSNIEHREFMKLEKDEKRQRWKAKAQLDPEFREKRELLQKARDRGKLSNIMYQKNMRMLEELHGK